MWWDSRQRLSVSLFLCVLYLPRFSVWQLFMLTVEGPLGTLVKGVLLSVKLAFLRFVSHFLLASSVQVLCLTV